MAKNYKQLIESIKGRINPEKFEFKKEFSDELATISYSQILTYIRFAMKSVEPEYTQKSKEAGKKVKTHLSRELQEVNFKYQGSVMTNTHIKGYSDIDLLVISEKFYQPDKIEIRKILDNLEKRRRYYYSIQKLERELHGIPYKGNELEDLRNLRIDSERILSTIYTICDISKPIAIKIKNLSLNREVDIVIANWYDDVVSLVNDKIDDYRGIQVYNKDLNIRQNPDYPFLSIKRINERSSATNGRLKKMIRFLKNVKASSELENNLNSFEINAICYDINIQEYQNLSFYELVPVVYNQIKKILHNDYKANNLRSVDEREFIFGGKTSKKEDLKKLLIEVESIFTDLKNTLIG